MRKPKIMIGDVCETRTAAGLAYIQYTHDCGKTGKLVRILPGFYSVRPDIAALATQKELYSIYFTLEYALKERDKFSIVSNQPVPDFAKSLPLMRKRGHTDHSGKTLFWYIGQAEKMSTLSQLQQAPRVTTLAPEHEKLSIEQLWPPPVMIARLESGWLPERDEEFRLKAIAKREESKESSAPVRPSAESIEHYFYFPRKSQADEAATLLVNKGLQTSVKKSADRKSWLTLATSEPPSDALDLEQSREEFERLAERVGGKYDGWGMHVSRQSAQRLQ